MHHCSRLGAVDSRNPNMQALPTLHLLYFLQRSLVLSEQLDKSTCDLIKELDLWDVHGARKQRHWPIIYKVIVV